MSLPRLVAVLLAGCALASCQDGGRTPGEGRGTQEGMPRLPLRVAHDLTVKRIEFGILTTDAAGNEHFLPATELPAVDGQVFGWVAEFATTRGSVRWQEHLTLPAPPADWGDAANDPDVLISTDGKAVAAQGEDAVENGGLSRFYWSLATGDPAGEYQLDVAIEGRTVAHFRFRVPAVVQEQALLVDAGVRGPTWLARGVARP
jgi:hypothetical protein